MATASTALRISMLPLVVSTLSWACDSAVLACKNISNRSDACIMALFGRIQIGLSALDGCFLGQQQGLGTQICIISLFYLEDHILNRRIVVPVRGVERLSCLIYIRASSAEIEKNPVEFYVGVGAGLGKENRPPTADPSNARGFNGASTEG